VPSLPVSSARESWHAGTVGDPFSEIFQQAACVGTVAAMRLDDGAMTGLGVDDLVTPASVMKVQVALAALDAITAGRLDGRRRLSLRPGRRRTPGPVGISLLADPVEASLRDLVTLMLTLSDNVATDAVAGAVGLEAVNSLTRSLGLSRTRIVGDIASMLDAMAEEVGFADYGALLAHEPETDGPPTADELRAAIAASAVLDPRRGSSTTAHETVELLRAIWHDTAASPEACRQVRRTMAQQLTRHRIASGFGPEVHVAAKSGGLMGVVRNEAGVVTLPDGPSVAVAVFTRTGPSAGADARAVDAAIGEVAAQAVSHLTTGAPGGT
jgi:beta-lactamase class A